MPVLLDGAQGVGAVPVDVARARLRRLRGRRPEVAVRSRRHGHAVRQPGAARAPAGCTRRGYANLADPDAGLDAGLHEDARRFDTLSLSAETVACALAAIERARVGRLGRRCTSARARSPRAWPSCSPSAGREPAPRGADARSSPSPSPDPEGERTLLAERGVIVRNIPGRPWLRASVGAWNDEGDLDRLLETLAG